MLVIASEAHSRIRTTALTTLKSFSMYSSISPTMGMWPNPTVVRLGPSFGTNDFHLNPE